MQTNNDISGVWYSEEFNKADNTFLRTELHYHADGTYEKFSKTLEIPPRKLLGYTYREEGQFKIENSAITHLNVTSYHNNGKVSPLAELNEVNPIDWSEGKPFAVLLSTNKNIMRVTPPPCGPGDVCVAHWPQYTIFFRE